MEEKYSNDEEKQYLKIISDIIENGNEKNDRTGFGTLSKFGVKMEFDLSDTFPLLTTKKIFWKGVVEELLWFIKGSTNSNELKEKGVGIWDANGSKIYLDSLGLIERNEGDLGPIYGFQWRHFGAEYIDMYTDYKGKGEDQLLNVINLIKNDPNSRRIVMSSWNPSDLKYMALPPCHMFCQFYVYEEKLSCLMYQRSGDLGLGVPFNIASYSLLTILIAHVTNLKPYKFTHVIGDAHVYKNHIEPLKLQLTREPKKFPQLKINKNKNDIESFEFEDFEILDYNPYPNIKMAMNV